MTEQAQGQTEQTTQQSEVDPLQNIVKAAGDDPEKLRQAIDTLYGVVRDTRGEAATRRKELRSVQEQLAKYENDRKDRERSEMTEIERLKNEKAELYQLKIAYEQQLDSMRAENAFIQKGAYDIKSLSLHWQALSPEQKKDIDPSTWAESMKTQLPHLFKPYQQSAQQQEPQASLPLATTGPHSTDPPQQTKKFTKVGKTSSSDELAAQMRRTLSSLK